MDYTGNLHRQQRWYRVSNLGEFVTQVSGKVVVIRKSLQPGGLPDSETSALRRIIVNVVVTVPCDVTRNRCRRFYCHLNPEPVTKLPFRYSTACIPMFRQQFIRKFRELGRPPVDFRKSCSEEITVKIRSKM